MISCLLVHLKRNPNGLLARNEQRIAAGVIELGRGAACLIHLPDHRVSLRHAAITRDDDGALRMAVSPGALIRVNGFIESEAELRPGVRIEIGPYRLSVEGGGEGIDLVLSIELLENPAEPVDAGRSTAIAPVLGIRRLSIALAIFVLLALFLLPLSTRVMPDLERWQAGLPLTLTGWLDPAPLSPGHRLAGGQCSACHERAFRAVPDAACSRCHENSAVHLATTHSRHGTLADVRCVDCHALHEGKVRAQPSATARCLACHAQEGGGLAKVLDFANDHPPLRLSLSNGRTQVRVEPKAGMPLSERTGIKFSHQVHLGKEGVSSPDGNTLLVCRSCHVLEDSGRHFAAMDMEKTCQQSRCHRLRFEEPASGFVPHGSVGEVMNRLRRAYAGQLAEAAGALPKDCAGVSPGTGTLGRALACADALAGKQAAETLFRESGSDLACALCHHIAATGRNDLPWQVAPLRIARDWMPAATFPHDRHATIDCTGCHDKSGSKRSEDVAMPRIEKCRECHGGEVATAHRLASPCQACHTFHRVPVAAKK